MPNRYELTRFVFLRFLGFIYFVAFFSLAVQLLPLLGQDGLLPAQRFLDRLRAGNSMAALWLNLPTLFWFNCSDAFLQSMALLGLGLSLALMFGLSNWVILSLLWFLYLSFTQTGQIFYGYGWEILLTETGFLAIFLGCPPSKLVLWLFRWLAFRLMFGAGLIKIRGDDCWKDLTALLYHFETQPIPNPVSWYLHQMPPVLLKLGVVWNHFVELIVPWFLFGTRRLRTLGAWQIIYFQLFLIMSGNLSFLNWLTITVCIPLLDDKSLKHFLPQKWAEEAAERCRQPGPKMKLYRKVILGVLALVIGLLSIAPVKNLLSPAQFMNASFDPLRLVNTYGAFGTVGRVRYEVVLQGTDAETLGPDTLWKEYEFPAKPGDIGRRPPFIAPYQPRLDWQIWFAAMSSIEREPWLVHLVYQLLEGGSRAARLLAHNPFPDKPPTYIRAELYEYRFTRFGEPKGAWWKRRRVGPYLSPVSLHDAGLRSYLRSLDLED